MIKCNYVVAEDSAGGLYLFILDDNDEITHAYGNFEYDPGSLTNALHELEEDREAYVYWGSDICEIHGADVDDFCVDNSLQVIKKRGLTWAGRMGAAARREFYVTEMECSAVWIAVFGAHIICTSVSWDSEHGQLVMFIDNACTAMLKILAPITFTLMDRDGVRFYRIEGGVCFELI